MSVISTATGTITATIGVGNGPTSVAFAQVPVTSPPAVTGVSPASGPLGGGTTVTITGTGFTATAPAHAAGTVDVTVTTPAGTSPVTSADRYTYVAPLTS